MFSLLTVDISKKMLNLIVQTFEGIATCFSLKGLELLSSFNINSLSILFHLQYKVRLPVTLSLLKSYLLLRVDSLYHPSKIYPDFVGDEGNSINEL